MIVRNYDAAIVRWFDCVERGSHRFNSAGACMDCGATSRGPEVKVRGGAPQRGPAVTTRGVAAQRGAEVVVRGGGVLRRQRSK